MHHFHLNESAFSDKGEVGLFKCKSSGTSIDTVCVYTKLKSSMSQVGWKYFFDTLKSLRMYQLSCTVCPCFHTVMVNA